MTDWLPDGWSIPQLLLIALVLSVVLAGAVAASTSQTAFGAYNAGWDGGSELRDVASEQGAEPLVALNTSKYETVEPNGTVAVILSPTAAYTETDRAQIASFVDAGGTLILAEDFRPHSTPILERLGAETRFDGAPLRDEQEYYRSPALPVATNVTDSSATAGVDQLTLNHATSLQTDSSANDTTVLASSSEYAYLDRDRDAELDDTEALDSRPVVVRERVGNGTVYVVSDPSLFINAMLDQPDNGQFTRNLFAADRVLFDYSHKAGQPPLRRAVLTLQDSPLWQLSLGLLGIGTVIWAIPLRRRLTAITDRFSRGDTAPDEPALADATPEDVIAYLSREHPDWDEDRLRRVMRGVIRRDTTTEHDD